MTKVMSKKSGEDQGSKSVKTGLVGWVDPAKHRGIERVG